MQPITGGKSLDPQCSSKSVLAGDCAGSDPQHPVGSAMSCRNGLARVPTVLSHWLGATGGGGSRKGSTQVSAICAPSGRFSRRRDKRHASVAIPKVFTQAKWKSLSKLKQKCSLYLYHNHYQLETAQLSIGRSMDG